MVLPSLRVLSLLSSVAGAIAVLAWRVRETRTAVSARKIVIPPLGMSTGFCMFFAPPFRVPLAWAAAAFALGALVLAYPLLLTSKLRRVGDVVMAQRSFAFFGVIVVLAAIRVGARTYLDHVLTVQQTAGLFFILAFGMILRWRMTMYVQYRQIMKQPSAAA
jgi:membrane protein CcdC involved in cytochrome C biogenesis